MIGSSCKWPKKRLTANGAEELVSGSLRNFHVSGPPLGEVCRVVIEVTWSTHRLDSWTSVTWAMYIWCYVIIITLIIYVYTYLYGLTV